MNTPDGQPTSPSFIDLRVAVGVLERDVLAGAKVTDKLAEAVEKIQEMNASLCKMIALHELRHDSAEKFHCAVDEDMKDLCGRVESLTRTSLIRRPTEESSTGQEVSKTLKELESWKYILIGAVFVLGWLLAHLRWEALVSLFR